MLQSDKLQTKAVQPFLDPSMPWGTRWRSCLEAVRPAFEGVGWYPQGASASRYAWGASVDGDLGGTSARGQESLIRADGAKSGCRTVATVPQDGVTPNPLAVSLQPGRGPGSKAETRELPAAETASKYVLNYASSSASSSGTAAIGLGSPAICSRMQPGHSTRGAGSNPQTPDVIASGPTAEGLGAASGPTAEGLGAVPGRLAEAEGSTARSGPTAEGPGPGRAERWEIWDRMSPLVQRLLSSLEAGWWEVLQSDGLSRCTLPQV